MNEEKRVKPVYPLTIHYGREYWKLYENGGIERPGLTKPCPDRWRVTGAVRYNNFGYCVERYTLADVLTKRLQWRYKNGKQRIHITDFDHGTFRMWGCPNHEVM